MTAATAPPRRAFAVWWKELERWSVSAFRAPSWKWPREQIKPLSFALERRHEPVNRKTFELRPEHFISLRFTGEIEPRDLHGKTNFKGGLFHARAGDLLYSKIDVRNGAIGIVPDAVPVAAVTSEFPVYRIRPEAALSEYVQLVFRTANFRGIINGMISGASGRKRVQPDDLERVKIPLPPLAEQSAIVARWREAQTQIAAARERVEAKKAEIDARFFADLGLSAGARAALPKCFAVWWKHFLRWGVNYNQQRQSGLDITQGKFPVVALGSILKLVQYGTSEKANSTVRGTPVLRIGNIKDRALDLSDIKHIELPQATLEGLQLREGDIVIIRTSGSRDLVGTCAVFHGTEDFVFASYLIRLRVMTEQADPEFVAWFINSPLGRQQVDSVSRQIMQNNINSEELRGLEIPLPPVPEQREIMARVQTGRAEITREREAAARLTREITTEIEARILGTGASE